MTTESFPEALSRALADAGDRPVLSADARVLSGRQLADDIERWAAGLAALGVRKGERVAVHAEKSLDLILLYLATLRLGALYLPLNTAYRAAELAYFLDDAEPVLFVCDPATDTVETASAPMVLTLGADGKGSLAAAIAGSHPAPPAVTIAPDDLAAIVYTSGTTGRSKGAMITHANLVSNARALIDAWGVVPDDRLLHALPLYHIHGLFIALNTMLLAGARTDLLPGFDADTVLDRLPDATLFMGVPTYYTRLLASPRLDRAAVAGMRLFVCGSAPLTPQTFAAFEDRSGLRILERYGMSECGIICSNPLDGARIPGAVGRPLAGVAARIAEGAAVGILEVRGPNVFAGYWRQPDKTAAEFRDGGWFSTGDVATIDTDGVVRIVGRDKDMIISGGLNVYPKEIEEMIDALPGVGESAVIGLPHPDFGEAVAAVIRPLPGVAVDLESVVGALRPRLASFKLPKAVIVVDELPRNAMGKVQKVALRGRYAGWFEGG